MAGITAKKKLVDVVPACCKGVKWHALLIEKSGLS